MADEQTLVLGLELLTEGRRARVPSAVLKEPWGEVLTTDQFRAESDGLRDRVLDWTHGTGVEGLGVGEKICDGQPAGELALRVYVERKRPTTRLRHPVPATVTVPEIGALVTDVIELGHIEPESFRVRARPAMPGCGVGHISATVGTFGCLVKRGNDDALYILSNSHVLADVGFAHSGDTVVQPGTADGGDQESDTIAKLSESIPFQFDDIGFDNQVDAAIARVRRKDWVVREIRELGVAPAGLGRVLRRGMHIKKVGRTTGYTTGVIQDIHFRTALTYPRPNGARTQRVGFKDQVLCSRYSDSGDSGAVVLNSSNRVLGLHFAGAAAGSVFNRISHVLRLLNVELA